MAIAAAVAMGSGWEPSDFKTQTAAKTDFRVYMRLNPKGKVILEKGKKFGFTKKLRESSPKQDPTRP